jgi:hypothetical protein
MKRENDALIPIRLISAGLPNRPNIPGDGIAHQKNVSDDRAQIPVGASMGEISGREGKNIKESETNRDTSRSYSVGFAIFTRVPPFVQAFIFRGFEPIPW